MATTMRLPELGENVESADVVTVLVKAGDRIEENQPVVEVETDKAAVEVPADVSGTVQTVHVKAGDTITSGDALVTVDEDGVEPAQEEDRETVQSHEEDDGAPASGAAAKEPPPAPPEPSTEAPAAEPTGPPAGDTRPEPPPEAAEPTRPPSEPIAPSWRGEPGPPRLVPAAPSVRRFAREVGVDITSIQGSGPGGRISIDDVKAESRRRLGETARGRGPIAAPELPDFSAWGEVSVEDMSKVRRLTADAMATAWATVPQVTQHDTADITELEQRRRRHGRRVEEAGGKLTVTAILVRVAASALKSYPDLNSSVDAERGRIIRKHSIHVGVAVDTPHGLLVPVIRDADTKNITTIAVELGDLADRARSRRLKPDEMQGATFTISNLGGIGGTAFTPIVAWPQVAILGVSRSRTEPVFIDGAFQPRLMLPLSLSYDHRLVDGAQAARFVRWVADALEDPLVLALEG